MKFAEHISKVTVNTPQQELTTGQKALIKAVAKAQDQSAKGGR